jgi:hypothetical protein
MREEARDLPPYEDTIDETPEGPEGHLVVDVVTKKGALRMRLHDVPVDPTTEGPRSLCVLEGARRIVRRVLRNPEQAHDSEEAESEDRFLTDPEAWGRLHDLRWWPRWREPLEGVRPLVKGKDVLGGGVDDGLANVAHGPS